MKKATPPYTLPTNLRAVWKDDLSSIALPKGFRWQQTGKVGEPGENTLGLTFTPADTVNYLTVKDIKVTIIVAKAIPQVTTPVIHEVESKDGLKLSDVALPAGWEWETPETALTKSSGYREVYTPTDTAHYTTVTAEIKVTLKPKQTPSPATNPPNPDGAAKPDGSTSVKTSDNTQRTLYIILFACATALLSVLGIVNRKKRA